MENPAYSMCTPLPAPGELFETDKPGLYRLVIQVNLVKQVTATNSWTRETLTTSPLTIMVEKSSP